MVEWVALFVMLIVIPAVVVWQTMFHGFIPYREYEAKVVRLVPRDEAVKSNRGVSHRKTITYWYPVVSVWVNGVVMESTSIIADHKRVLEVGDVVTVILGRKFEYCIIKDVFSA